MRWRHVLTASIALLPGVALAGTSIDLGVLDVDPDRIPQWYAPKLAEAHYQAAREWPEYDATCERAPCSSQKPGFRDAPGDPMASCSAANPANDGGEDWKQIDCMLDRTPESSVVYLPAGTYDMGNEVNEALSIGRSNVALRCESPARTHLRLAKLKSDGTAPTAAASCGDSDFPANMNCKATVVSVGAPYEGPAVRWTGGYTEEAKVISVSTSTGFSVGGWIMLEIPNAANDCRDFLPVAPHDTRNSNHALNHIAKIVAINGNQITIDRGLRMDYTADAGCTNSAVARPYRPISGVGVEGCHMVSDSSIPQDNLRDFPFAHFGAGTVESWFVGNELERGEAQMFAFHFAARNWFQGNVLENYGRIDERFNTSGIAVGRGSVDNVIENNVWRDYVVGVYNVQGPEGTVVAYNYMRFGSPPNVPERALFNHGLYTREILFEGNDTDGKIVTGDHWWGSQGPRNTVFRNRAVGNGPNSAVVVNRDKAGPWIIADRVNWIGNIASFFYNSPECVNGFPSCLNTNHDFDGDGTDASARVTNMHVEKNVYRNTTTCATDPTPNRCGFHQDTPRPDTSCGTGSTGDCAGGTGDNAGGVAPASWAGEKIPHSLYRPSTTPPSWWCEEACAWSDVHDGIGAWGDDFGAGLCKLPAQILAEGGVCTTSAGSSLAAPVLLVD